MAILKNNQFGALSGKLGNMVFRQVHGKTIVSSLPDRSNTPVSAVQKKQNNKFAVAVRFAVAVNNHDRLRALWQYRGSAPYRRIFAANIKCVSETGPTTENIIVPPGGFPVAVSYDAISRIGLTLRLSDISDFPCDSGLPEQIGIAALHCWMNPVNPKEKPFYIESFYREYPTVRIVKGSQLKLSDKYAYESVADIYRSKIVYFAIILPDPSIPGKYIHSETVAVEV
ncbi:MAG: hypothetical protein AB9882_01320 [Ignavibacteriaceae bacterium]